MDKKKKVFAVAMVVAILATMSAAVTPVSAYTIRPVHDGVQLYMEDRGDAWHLFRFSGCAADVIISVARVNRIDNRRTRGNIAGEIRAHALVYLVFGDGEPQNPMSIVLTEPDSWRYHLMD